MARTRPASRPCSARSSWCCSAGPPSPPRSWTSCGRGSDAGGGSCGRDRVRGRRASAARCARPSPASKRHGGDELRRRDADRSGRRRGATSRRSPGSRPRSSFAPRPASITGAERPGPGREHAARPAAAVDERRRPRHARRAQQARRGDPALQDGRRQEPRLPQGSCAPMSSGCSEKVRAGEAALLAARGGPASAGRGARRHASRSTRKLEEQREDAAKAERAAALAAKLADAAQALRAVQARRRAARRDRQARSEPSVRGARCRSCARPSSMLRKLEFEPVARCAPSWRPSRTCPATTWPSPTPRWRPWLHARQLCFASWPARCWRSPCRDCEASIARWPRARRRLRSWAGLALWRRCRAAAKLERHPHAERAARNEIARRLAGRTELAERVRQAEQERVEALELARPGGPRDGRACARRRDGARRQIGAQRAEYRGMMGEDPSGEDVAALRDQAAAEADECRHTLAGMGEHRRGAGAKLCRVPACAAAPRSRARARPSRPRPRPRHASTTTTSMPSRSPPLPRRSNRPRKQLAAAERRLRIYEDVLTTLNDSERGTMKKAARFLEQRMARTSSASPAAATVGCASTSRR